MRENIKHDFDHCGNFQTEHVYFLSIVWGQRMQNVGWYVFNIVLPLLLFWSCGDAFSASVRMRS